MKTNSNFRLKRPALLALATALVLGAVIDRAAALETPAGGGASLPPAVQTQFTVNQTGVPALPVPGKTQQLVSPDQVPEGLAKSDWSSIRAAYEAGRHAFQPTATGWQARNPGQQWTTTFDQRGFLAQPADGAWTWGLELRSYGFGESQRAIGGTPAVQAGGQRLSYQWDANLQEWFVNDQRGLEHGFTVSQRPAVPLNTQPSTLSFLLATRGTLRPSVSADAKGVLFQDAHGATVLNYNGLKVWDADGQVLTAHFEAAGENRVRLLVDERAARYPIIIDPIAQQAYLKASNPEEDDVFGLSVAVSGDTVVVAAKVEASDATGVNGDQSDNHAFFSGAVYVFVRNGTTWSQQAYLKASNTEAVDRFGDSVAVSGDTVVVGAESEDSNATGVNGDESDNSASASGAAYVFVRNGTSWSQQAYLKASNTEAGDGFGFSVAVSGDTVVVGARSEGSNASGINGDESDNSALTSGAAYVFVRSGTSWSQEAYLKASNPGAGDRFGWSVAMSGGTVVVAASFEASNATGVNLNQSDNSANASGAAYVFVRSGTNWSQQAYLKASNTETGDNFGWSVAVSGDTVVVGALGENSNASGVNGNQSDNSAFSSGAAYVFVRNGTSWSQQAYLKASNPGVGDRFGRSVAVSGGTVVVGAFAEGSNATGVNGDQSDNSARTSGAAYVFVRSGTNWSQQAYLKASNTEEFDSFGDSVAVSGDTVVVGAHGDASNASGVNGDQSDNSAEYSGAAYVFTGLGIAVDARFLLDVIYDTPVIDFGPLSFGLSELPEEPHPTFSLREGTPRGGGATGYDLSDVISANLIFGDVIGPNNLTAFNMEVAADGTVESLTYQFSPIDTPTVQGPHVLNFPFTVTGTDIASGEAFSYTYANSTATITPVPEPIALSVLGLTDGTLTLTVENIPVGQTFHLRQSTDLTNFEALSPPIDITDATPQPLEITLDPVTHPALFFSVYAGPSPAP